MTEEGTVDPSVGGGWLFLVEGDVPERWKGRAVPVLFVPLLPRESAEILAGNPVRSELNADDEALIRLLSRGSTVATAARQLGLHPRTVERRLAALRERLGVATTAELTRLVSRRGF